jgi:hypothetical protein
MNHRFDYHLAQAPKQQPCQVRTRSTHTTQTTSGRCDTKGTFPPVDKEYNLDWARNVVAGKRISTSLPGSPNHNSPNDRRGESQEGPTERPLPDAQANQAQSHRLPT